MVYSRISNIFYVCTSIGVVQALIDELDLRFPAHHVMDAMGIMFPQYWVQEGADRTFSTYISILKDALCYSKCLVQVEGEGKWVKLILSAKALDKQSCMFHMSMLNQSKLVMQPLYHLNRATKIWQIMGANGLLQHAFPEYFKLVTMALILVPRSVEDERAFSTISFIKRKLQNKLVEYLPLCVKMFTQNFYTLRSFSYQEVVDIWKVQKHRYCMQDPV
jgi:hypothetical protein